LILALAEGKSYKQIETELNTSRPTIARWKSRFEKSGMAGLEPQHQGSKPRTVTPAVQAKGLRRTPLVQIGSCDDFGRSRCVDPETDRAANAAR
jgi:transposase